MANQNEITDAAANSNSSSTSSLSETTLKNIFDHVKSIDDNLKSWSKDGVPSQANARSFSDNGNRDTFRRRQSDRSSGSSFSDRDMRRSMDRTRKGFMDSFESAIYDGFLGSGFKRDLQNVFKGFADQLGTDIRGISSELGKQLGQNAVAAFKQSNLGRNLTAQYGNARQNVLNYIQNRGTDFINRVTSSDGALGAEAINRHMDPLMQSRGVGGAIRTGLRGTGHLIGSVIGGGANAVRGWIRSPETISGILNGTNPLTQAPASGGARGLSGIAGMAATVVGNAVKDSNITSSGGSILDSPTSQADPMYSMVDYIREIRDILLNTFGNQGALDEVNELNVDELMKEANGPTSESLPGANALEELIPEPTDLVDLESSVANFGESVTAAGGEAAASMGSLAAAAGPAVVAFVALRVVTGVVSKSLQDFKKGISQIFGAMSKAANRDQNSREQNLKLAKERMKEDYETLVKYPFDLLKSAAEDLYQSWNQNLEVVSATQGYTKSDVQDLMAAYAERIRGEGLSKYVSGSDLFNNLANVLKSGMSGAVAEEFAYQATVLNKAVPTQDFFQYASTYASIAANAIRAGESQQSAIAKANESLESFASGILYTTRELTGGFTTGLQNASSIYEDAAKIAVAARSENIDAISSSLLAIQGYVGAVAPDLASALTSTIYNLATGGNDSSTVALRSLAGVNASNTEFLKAFASNPQQVLGTMFENLANMYTQSPDAYMEKAEGYAQLFGLDSQAFQRIDFADLANAIRSMTATNDSLDENMGLLLEGQTTTTAEQLKAQQINQYMIEEGLAYVIDNEVAQMIQQHMWDEQLNRQLMEANYSVDLIGDSKEGLMNIVKAVQNILNFLNPFGWLKKIGNLFATADEGFAQEADVRQVLELGKVGQGNQADLYRLVTRNQDLHVTRSIVDQMGGRSMYASASSRTQGWNQLANPLLNSGSLGELSLAALQANTMNTPNVMSPKSRYSWGQISKTQGSLANSVLKSGADAIKSVASQMLDSSTGGNVTASAAKSAVDKMMEESYIKDQFVKQNKSYEDWVASASKFGISDFKQALESAGYEESDVKRYFEDYEAKAGQEEAHERDMREEQFWKDGQTFWNDYFPTTFDPKLFDTIKEMEEKYLQEMINRQDAMILQNIDIIKNQNNIKANQLLFRTMWLGDDKTSGAWGQWVGKDGLWKQWAGVANKDSSFTWQGFTSAVSKFWGFDNKGEGGTFQKLYRTISDYMLYKSYYGVSSNENVTKKTSDLLKDLESIKRDTEKENRDSAADKMAKVLADTIIDNSTKDPTLQTNVLLGQILVYVGQIVQQTNSVGGSTMIPELVAMALGMEQPTSS